MSKVTQQIGDRVEAMSISLTPSSELFHCIRVELEGPAKWARLVIAYLPSSSPGQFQPHGADLKESPNFTLVSIDLTRKVKG